eukprot:gb/GECH01011091.1/.p1 GENE.gb/GECH01011091.1/~~gb/GECH01011091.1/.p1  ORF type:complete len:171 (+),score=37.93 gb/GECH01011091.1/:1-513(+)
MSSSSAPENFFDLSAKKINGKEQQFSDYKGKVVLVVNTASKCGFTPQYEQLESLYKKHKDEGLMILGFPCNQFASQDPGSNDEISNFCQVNYGVSFPMFEKVKVNGNDTHPVFAYLKNHLRGSLGTQLVKWNFTKFLVARDGTPVKRYSPTTNPNSFEADIEAELKKSHF